MYTLKSFIISILLITLFGIAPAHAQGTEQPPRVVLLLHGMNSAPDTWDPFLNDIGANAPKIVKGVLTHKAKPKREVYYYVVKFGTFDASSDRTGLEGLQTDHNSSGDFSSFSTLGKEVRLAVDGVLEKHPGAEIVLVGHSRGGIAAREFLQKTGGNSAKAAVIGYLSLGTPHLGSELARVNPYLLDHTRLDDPSTWNFADVSRNQVDLDVRRPTLRDLAVGSDALKRFNAGVGRLPVEGIKYRTYIYAGRAMGKFEDIDIFSTGPVGISDEARDYMLQSHSPKFLDGDGLVTSKSQRFDQLGRTRSALDLKITRVRGGVFHTEEPERTSDLLHGLRSVAPWTFLPKGR